ncbi:sulfatase-like hydrolase/transferase, partial [Variovorax sp. J31P207]|uniref:sulfatase-like hydrolase/transferase n=1 Tax=Variovorax sp. J31P207 TaxID=3053510 RepID=UPI0025781311
GGETNQWSPLLYDGVTRVELPADPNYHFMTDMTNQAIAWTRFQQSMTPDRPFFMYFAPGATHAPHHVSKEWADKYKGKFDEGWDKYREDALARQIRLGIVPAGTKLAPKPAGIKDWDKLTPDERRLFARQMEVFAGFSEQADYEIGRLVKAIEDLGVMDNTLFIYVAGDNGASAEGGATGLFNELTFFNGVPETVENQLKNLDKWGGPESRSSNARGGVVGQTTPLPMSSIAKALLMNTGLAIARLSQRRAVAARLARTTPAGTSRSTVPYRIHARGVGKVLYTRIATGWWKRATAVITFWGPVSPTRLFL